MLCRPLEVRRLMVIEVHPNDDPKETRDLRHEATVRVRDHRSLIDSWTLDDDGLIKASIGTYDAAEYARQLEHGV